MIYPRENDDFIRRVVNHKWVDSKFRLLLQCGHQRWWNATVLPKSTFCSKCKTARERMMRDFAKDNGFALDTLRNAKVCKHGLELCIACKTARTNVTEVRLEDIPF